MKYCQKCGKELNDAAVICPGCGCPVNGRTEISEKDAYRQAAQCATRYNVIGCVLLALGVAVAWFINYWIGAALLLAAELVCLTPNTKVQSLFKRNNQSAMDKKQFKNEWKALTNELKKENGAYRISFAIAIIALICLIAVLFMANALGI